MPTPLKFEATQGEPTILKVIGVDGKPYRVAVQLTILGVEDTGMLNPINNLPLLAIRSGMVADVQPG